MQPVTFVLLLVVPQLGIAQQHHASCDAHSRPDCVARALDSAAAQFYRSVGQVLECLPDSARPTFLIDEARWAQQQAAQCRERTRGLSPGPEDRVDAECRKDAADQRTDYLRQKYSTAPAFAHGGCIAYGPATLTGRLERRSYPTTPLAPTGMGTEAAETGLYLAVAPGVCVTRNLDRVNEPVAGVTLIELISDSRRPDAQLSSVGKQVTVRGILSHAFPTPIVTVGRDGERTATHVQHHAELTLRVVE